MASPFTNPIALPDGLTLLAWLDDQVAADARELASRANRPGEADALQSRRELVDWCRTLLAAALRRDGDHVDYDITAGFTALDAARLAATHYAARPGYDPRWRPTWR